MRNWWKTNRGGTENPETTNKAIIGIASASVSVAYLSGAVPGLQAASLAFSAFLTTRAFLRARARKTGFDLDQDPGAMRSHVESLATRICLSSYEGNAQELIEHWDAFNKGLFDGIVALRSDLGIWYGIR